MAYVNVAEWSPDQVAEWLKGLDDVLHPYIHNFVSKNVDGKRLLHLAVDDFPSLNVTCIGHQEIILQGVELLNNIHYQIHQENVQQIALRLSSKARSIYNELQLPSPSQYRNGNLLEDEMEGETNDLDSELNGTKKEKKKERVSTRIVSCVADVLSSVKTLVSWLHRTPFHGIEHYDELKSHLVDLSIRLATIAQRDTFAENPVSVIRESCLKFAEMADSIIQDSKDPLILQPASLDVVTIKKRADDNWGLGLISSYHGIHQISILRALSPAHTCGKLMGGDQVVQVNYQTVVGWTSFKVTQSMQENPVQVILTVKKCPRHVNTITEIYFKPIRLPSKKRTYSPWINNGISSQRYDLQSIPNLQFIKSYDGRSAAQRAVNTEPHPKSLTPPVVAALNSSGSDIAGVTASESDSNDEASDLDDDTFMSDADFGGTSSLSGRLFQPKPRPHVQRRATIPGATARHTLPFNHLLQDFCHRQIMHSPIGDSLDHDSYVFRSKDSAENRIIRPHTCIGTEKKEMMKTKYHPRDEGEMPFIDESDEKEDTETNNDCDIKSQLSSPANNKSNQNNQESLPPNRPLLKKESSSSLSPIKNISPKVSLSSSVSPPKSMSPPKSPIEAINELRIFRRISDDRPKLDKSYSSPTYDLDDGEAASFLERKVEKISPADAATDSDSLPSVFLNSTKEELNNVFLENEIKSGEKPTIYSKENVLRDSPKVLAYESFQSPSDSEERFSSHYDDACQKSVASLALSTIAITTTTVPSLSASKSSLYSPAFRGNCVSSVKEFKSATNPETAYKVMCETSLSSNSSTPISKYVDMNKPFDPSKPLEGLDVKFSPTNNDYINCVQSKNNGDGFNCSTNNVTDCGGVGCWVGRVDSSNDDKKTDVVVGADSSASQIVVLREGKSDSPSAWRRGVVIDGSGNRRISCRDLGQGDHHGWLYRRKDTKGFLLSHRWEKRWFILKKSYLYGYRDKDALKADSLIYLPGFRVCPASDVKSKRFAFKIYHSSGATFYFACDTAEVRSRWMSQMGLSAISSVSQYQEEQVSEASDAYYSETDDELEKSPVTTRCPQTPTSRVSPGRGSSSSVNKSSTPSVSSNSRISPSSRISPIGSLTSLGGGKGQGLRFLSSSKTSLCQPVPTPNFRSYVRVRDPSGQNISPNGPYKETTAENPKDKKKDELDSEKGKQVRRKGSLRERLKHLPSSLTLDRRKNAKVSLPSLDAPPASVLRPVTSSKSETSLLDSPKMDQGAIKEFGPSKSNSQLPSYMRPTHSSSIIPPCRPSTDNEVIPQQRLRNGSPTAVNGCISSKSNVGRRGSIGGLSLSSSSLRSLSPRRGSLDCLVSKGTSPPVSPLRTGLGSSGSIVTQEQYREGSPEKLWISSLRSNSSKTRPSVVGRIQVDKINEEQSKDDVGTERLKRTINYQPPFLRNRNEVMMQPAFEMALTSPHDTSRIFIDRKVAPRKLTPYQAAADKISPQNMQSTPNQRPQVPPRTKFLSPDERLLSPTFSNISSSASPRDSPPIYVSSIIRSKVPPNLTLSPANDESESPRTPLKPTMGVAMIGKQRRTPGVLSPREILPHYPGMEYPPTFEPESYTLNLPCEFTQVASRGQSAADANDNSHQAISPYRGMDQEPLNLSHRQMLNAGYVNISHVSNTLADFNSKGYHHSIYVTSPSGQGAQQFRQYDQHERMISQDSPPPTKPCRSLQQQLRKRFVTSPPNSEVQNSLSSPPTNTYGTDSAPQYGGVLNEYVPMGVVNNAHTYMNASSFSRNIPKLGDRNEGNSTNV